MKMTQIATIRIWTSDSYGTVLSKTRQLYRKHSFLKGLCHGRADDFVQFVFIFLAFDISIDL